MQPFNANPQANPQTGGNGYNPNDPNNFQPQQQQDQYGQPMMNYDPSQSFNQAQQPAQGAYDPNNFQNPTPQPGYSNPTPTGFDPYAPNISHLDYNSINQGQSQPNFDPYQQQSSAQAPSYDQPLMANEMPTVDPGFNEKKKGNNLFIIIAAVVAVILAIVLGVLIFLNFSRSNEGTTNTSQSSSETQTVIISSSESNLTSSSLSSSGVVISQPTMSRSNASNPASIRSSTTTSNESVSTESQPNSNDAPTVIL